MSKLCMCVFPTLSPYVNGVCDKCGGEFFDQRDLLPLETVATQTIEGEKTRILNTADNRERMKTNEEIVAKRIAELGELGKKDG